MSFSSYLFPLLLRHSPSKRSKGSTGTESSCEHKKVLVSVGILNRYKEEKLQNTYIILNIHIHTYVFYTNLRFRADCGIKYKVDTKIRIGIFVCCISNQHSS